MIAHTTLVGREDSGEDFGERRFPPARGAEERHTLARLDRQSDAPETTAARRKAGVVDVPDPLELDDGHCPPLLPAPDGGGTARREPPARTSISARSLW